MKRNTILILITILAFSAVSANAQFGRIKRAIDQVKKENNKEAKSDDSSSNQPSTNSNPKSDSKSDAEGEQSNTVNSAKKIVFSNQPIDPANPQNLKPEFNAGEHIYGLLILDEPFNEFIGTDYINDPDTTYTLTRPVLKVYFYFEDEDQWTGDTMFAFSLKDKENMWKNVPTDRYFFFDIAPDPAKQKTYNYKNVFFGSERTTEGKIKVGSQYHSWRLTKKLKPGENKVYVKLGGKDDKTVSGEFTINGSATAFYKGIYEGLEEATAANTTMPESRWNNPQLVQTVKRIYKKRVTGERILRVELVNPGWFIQRNALGQIVHRGVFAAIATKTPDGKCYVQQEYIKANYIGGGRYSSPFQDGKSETRKLIPCENINK